MVRNFFQPFGGCCWCSLPRRHLKIFKLFVHSFRQNEFYVTIMLNAQFWEYGPNAKSGSDTRRSQRQLQLCFKCIFSWPGMRRVELSFAGKTDELKVMQSLVRAGGIALGDFLRHTFRPSILRRLPYEPLNYR